MVENLVKDEKKLNEITDYLFKLLEQRSLFGASEYLALKVLNVATSHDKGSFIISHLRQFSVSGFFVVNTI